MIFIYTFNLGKRGWSLSCPGGQNKGTWIKHKVESDPHGLHPSHLESSSWLLLLRLARQDKNKESANEERSRKKRKRNTCPKPFRDALLKVQGKGGEGKEEQSAFRVLPSFVATLSYVISIRLWLYSLGNFTWGSSSSWSVQPATETMKNNHPLDCELFSFAYDCS